MRILHAFVLASAAMVAGCASFPSYQASLPEGYVGPKASIQDTARTSGGGRADLFYLEKVDERQLRDSRVATILANRGRGAHVVPVVLAHDVPAKPTKFSVVAVTHYGAPILAMTNTVLVAQGVVEFVPEENAVYVVRGNLSVAVSSVWVEEQKTGRVVGNKVEVLGRK